MDDPKAPWPVWLTVGPYVLLALLATVTVADKQAAGLPVRADLVLCALVAGWMAAFVHRPTWRGNPRVMGVFFAVLALLTMILVLRSSWFGFFTPVGYVFAFRLLPWPGRLAGIGAAGVTAGFAQAYGVDAGTVTGVVTYAAVVAVNVVPMWVLAFLVQRDIRHGEERERALREAHEANSRLAVSLEENAALHERLLAQAREAGVQDERQRMAREIHDTLAQGLTGIISQLRAAEHTGDDSHEWRRHVAAASKLAGESLSEARRSVHALRPEPLRSAGLSGALAGIAERWSALHGIPVKVTTTGTVRPIGPKAEAALVRTVQEALANVAKHARATRVGVTLSYLEGETALDVRDDGDGFDPARLDGAGTGLGNGTGVDRGGFGLVAMRQRVEGLAGSLQVESEPGNGTGISVRVPAERAEAYA